MIIKQFSCIEGEKEDLRQSKAVLKYRPGIVIREAPNNSLSADSVFNKYPVAKKPFPEFKKEIENLRQISKKYPWVVSDIEQIKNIKKLWDSGHDVKIYNVDGPPELLRQESDTWRKISKPYRRGTHLIWWVKIYLREQIMTKYISQIFAKHKDDKDLVVLIFVQKFHWLNIKYRLSHPNKNDVWNYYFGKFKNIGPKEVEKVLKEGSPVLYKYWKKAKN